MLGDLLMQAGWSVAVLEEVPAGLGRDGEARGHRQAEPGHLGQIGALAAEQVDLGAVTVGEGEDIGVRGDRTRRGRCRDGHGIT